MENIQICNACDSTAQHKYGSTILSLLLTDFVIVDLMFLILRLVKIHAIIRISFQSSEGAFDDCMDITQSRPGSGYHLLMRIS